MGQAKPIRRSTVLVLEGDDEQRSLVGTLFEESGFEVIECDTAEEALALARERPDRMAFVFCDVHLTGDLDGLNLAHTIRNDLPHVPVILTSGEAGKRDLPDNAVFMQKPWRPLDLLVRAEHIRARLQQ
jgi:CheY-like chemotaxis protein